jgi:hypothetical protein
MGPPVGDEGLEFPFLVQMRSRYDVAACDGISLRNHAFPHSFPRQDVARSMRNDMRKSGADAKESGTWILAPHRTEPGPIVRPIDLTSHP